jgi:hypothetical protein
MRLLSALAVAALFVGTTQAQSSAGVQASPASSPLILVEVPTASLPAGLLESLPPIPEDAEFIRADATVLAPRPLGTLAYSLPAAVTPKDENTGLLFAVLLVGGGHFYAGEIRTGVTLLAISLGSLVVSQAVFLNSESLDVTPLLLGYAVSLGAWIYGVADAKAAVRRANARNGFSAMPAPISNGDQLTAGIALRTRF